MLKPLNHINVLFWCVALVCPFLFQTIGIIDVSEYKISPDNGLWSRGLMSRDKYRFYTAVLLLVFYGASLKTTVPASAFPIGPQIAWQAHLSGAMTGFFLAVIQRLKGH
mgnify:CR=1 FL=1